MLYLVNILGCKRQLAYPTSQDVSLGQYLRQVIVPVVGCRMNEESLTAHVHVQVCVMRPSDVWMQFNDANCNLKVRDVIADESTLFYSCDVIEDDDESVAGNMGTEPLQECGICLDKMWKPDDYVLLCGHRFHVRCLLRHVYGGNRTCPTCRGTIGEAENGAIEWTKRMGEMRRI